MRGTTPVMRWRRNSMTAIDDEDDDGEEDEFGEGVAGGLEAVNNFGHEIVENEADAGVGEDVERGAEEIEAKELGGFHLHAAGKRRGHRVQAGDEFGKDEGGAAAFVEGFGGAQDAGFGVEGEAAEEAEEGPSGVAAEDEEE